MNIQQMKDAGVRFSYTREGVFPQIPYTQDVLYVLRLADAPHERGAYNSTGVMNFPTYTQNLLLVASGVSDVLFMDPFDGDQARKVVAEAILDLCPEDAKCLFHDALVDAHENFVGQLAPSRGMSRDAILSVCSCRSCQKILRRERC